MKKREEIDALKARVAELEKLVRELQARPVYVIPVSPPPLPTVGPMVYPFGPLQPAPAPFPNTWPQPIITCAAVVKPSLTFD